jgi:predicted nucleic-acid-binding Zn-ribbon protein
MMKDGHCPMCNSNEVYSNPRANFGAGSQYVDVDDRAGLTPYVCASCGFTAMYVDSMDDLKDLIKSEGWQKV